MPTGYTADIPKGITFEQFAMNCARAFGALVLMRDDPADAPIPDQFAVDDYYAKSVAEKRDELGRFMALTQDDLQSEYRAACAAIVARNAELKAETANIRDAYLSMLSKVQEWVPPTPDHYGMKKFMIEQIEQSIDFDCHEYADDVPASFDEWRANRSAELHRSVAYAAKSLAEETERVAQRTRWVQALKASLAKDQSNG